jgi:OHCU decarboxylase
MTRLVEVGELNRLPRDEFVAALRPLFEAAEPLAEALQARRPFTSYQELLAVAEEEVQRLPREQQIDVVNAHPRIGESPERVSALSYAEQGYATEDRAAMAAVYQELRALNEKYEQRFGFRFVVFVNGRPKTQISEVLRERLQRQVENELRTATHEMLAIARDRLAKLGG